MPTLLAAAVASGTGWICDAVTRPVIGLAGSLVVGLVASSVVFLLARRFFDDLRGGR